MSAAVAAASITWLAVLAIATGVIPDSALAGVVSRFASYICHQQPDRTFHWHAAAWPVCARCLGLYAGAPAAAVAALVMRRPGWPGRRNFVLLGIAAIPSLATWAAERALGWPVSNTARFAAALPLGAAVAWIIVRTLQYTLPDVPRDQAG